MGVVHFEDEFEHVEEGGEVDFVSCGQEEENLFPEILFGRFEIGVQLVGSADCPVPFEHIAKVDQGSESEQMFSLRRLLVDGDESCK